MSVLREGERAMLDLEEKAMRKKLSDFFFRLRSRSNYGIAEVEKATEIPRQTLYNLESEKSPLKVSQFFKLLSFYGASADDFLNHKINNPKEKR